MMCSFQNTLKNWDFLENISLDLISQAQRLSVTTAKHPNLFMLILGTFFFKIDKKKLFIIKRKTSPYILCAHNLISQIERRLPNRWLSVWCVLDFQCTHIHCRYYTTLKIDPHMKLIFKSFSTSFSLIFKIFRGNLFKIRRG